jgi:hypothetical protein
MASKSSKESQFRTDKQNALMWSMLRDISKQVVWHGQMLSDEEWKWIFSAAVRSQKMVPGINGGLVLIGYPTSGMSKRELSDMLDIMGSFGAEHGVDWTDSL